MVKAVAVIGAGFGDEGKGLMTDYHAYAIQHELHEDCVVVRYNGGAQAGHTVMTPGGQRHIFHHFGSGTFCGAPTHLSRFFISNPYMFLNEYKELGTDVRITVDPDSLITTPWDMAYNQLIELKRKSYKHGSCGVGINSTVDRCNTKYATTVRTLLKDNIVEKYRSIRDNYYIPLLESEGIKLLQMPLSMSVVFTAERLLEKAANEFYKFIDKIECVSDKNLNPQNVVFEGAQGLLLDEDSKYFPNVTRSKTGLPNILKLCKSFGISDLDICYVTRCYKTRHGAGHLPFELKGLMFPGAIDGTNETNTWQGNFRHGLLDLDELMEAINNDISNVDDSVKTYSSIAVTCMDQVEDNDAVLYVCDNKINLVKDKFEILKKLNDEFDTIYYSEGPTRIHVKKENI